MLLAALSATAPAQSPPTAEQYQDALNQLKAAQDRKNELATENGKLRQQIAEAEKKSTQLTEQINNLENRAYYLREHYAAWQQFIEQNSAIRVMWSAYFANAEANNRIRDILGDGHWPFSIQG
jgi:predicted nuclease with TOPRIM domain